MQFLTPLFWLGALAIAVPIFLHLVRREKTKRIPFASLMFLRRIPIKELRRRRLTHLFLLFLRCLGLILIVAAFARPLVTAAWLTRANPLAARSVAIVLDRSLSMSRQPVWEKALQAAEEKIRSLDSSDEAVLIQFGETVEVLSQWESSAERLRQILRAQVKPSYELTSYAEALRMAAEQLEDAHNAGREIYLITDLQQIGMSAENWRVPENITVEIEDVGTEAQNVFVEEVRLEREFFTSQYPHPVLARVRTTPRQTASGEAQLFVEGRLIDRQPFEMDQGGTANLTFQPFPLDEGISRGKIVLEPADDLAADNVFHFVVERQKPRRIAVLQERGHDPAVYLQSALSSGKNLPFSVEFLSPAQLSQIEASDTPLVILNDLQRLPRLSLYQPYLQKGGGLIIALGNSVNPQAYNQEWGKLLPAEIVSRNFVRGQQKPFTSITDANWEHPIFAIFRNAHRAAISGTQFYSYWRLAPKAEASVLARFNEGDPALVEQPTGKGKILIFASSLDSVWTDFPLRSAYVPFWYRTAQYTAGWQESPAALRINQVVPVQDPLRESGPGTSGSWNLIDPRGQRVLGLDEKNPGFVQLKLPGHYEIRSNKRTDWLAVNCPPEESDLTRIPLEEFQAAFIPAQGRMEETQAAQAGGEAHSQQSLWWVFLIAACAVFVTESWVASRS